MEAEAAATGRAAGAGEPATATTTAAPTAVAIGTRTSEPLRSAYPFIKVSVQLSEDLTINVTRAHIIFAPLLADDQEDQQQHPRQRQRKIHKPQETAKDLQSARAIVKDFYS